jgi:TrmH family RNA methyltransferase
VEFLRKFAQEISEQEFMQLSPIPVRTGVVALARKPKEIDIAQIDDGKPIIFIQNPRDINNVGAVVRVAAGFGAVAVVISGTISPWHADAIRAGAGLQFALPIAQINEQDFAQIFANRQIVACDADGENMYEANIAPGAALVFGTERAGITSEMKSQADKIISIPMQSQVSSLNLATSVSAVLYGAMR